MAVFSKMTLKTVLPYSSTVILHSLKPLGVLSKFPIMQAQLVTPATAPLFCYFLDFSGFEIFQFLNLNMFRLILCSTVSFTIVFWNICNLSDFSMAQIT